MCGERFLKLKTLLTFVLYSPSNCGAQGTSRPTHYHVLLDQVGFSPDQLQELVHSLSYV